MKKVLMECAFEHRCVPTFLSSMPYLEQYLQLQRRKANMRCLVSFPSSSTLIMNPCLKMEKIQLMHSKKDQIHRFLFIKAMKLILLCNLYDNQMDKSLVTIVCLSTL